MSNVADTYGQAQATIAEQRHQVQLAQASYHAVFYGRPTPEDQRRVREDLESFCGMRRELMRETFHDSAFQLGGFRVWQRIFSFCFPRPADATTDQGGHHDRSEQRAAGPTPGGGVAQPTAD